MKTEWQPIETLKKESTKKYVLFGFFYSDASNYENNEHADCFIQLGFLACEGSYYVVCGAPSNQYVSLWLDVEPTHWMPLPTAP